jgi:hypothetical protein
MSNDAARDRDDSRDVWTLEAIRHREELLDESLMATFPASDPVSSNRFD